MFGNDCCCLRRFTPQLQAYAISVLKLAEDICTKAILEVICAKALAENILAKAQMSLMFRIYF